MMSANNSNLDSLHYDMVVGLTQNSINKKMKDMLTYMDQELAPAIFVYTDFSCTAIRQLNPTETDAFLKECDPFSIPNGTTPSTGTPAEVASGNKQMQYLFAYGFKATMGLPIPEGTPPYAISDVVDALPTIIHLPTSSGSQVVNYCLYYKTFQMVQQVYGMMGFWTIQNYQQTTEAPYLFNYNVNLDLSSTNQAFSELSQEQQAVFKNMDTDTMFSVNQLMLDLESPVLISGEVQIEGLDATDPNYTDIVGLLQTFTVTYFAFLESSGGAIFSTTVTPVDTPAPPATIVPTDFNFIVKNYAGSGTAEEIEGLSTLNYLIMSNGNALPSPLNNLTWDWLNQEEDTSTDGIMSVARSQFVSYLKRILDPCFAGICLAPTPFIQGPNRGKAKDDTAEVMRVTYAPTSTPGKYTLQSISQAPHTLAASWVTDPNPIDECEGYGSLRAKSEAKSDIYLSGDTIKCEFTVATKLWIDMYRAAGLTSSTVEGWAVAQKSTTQYTIKISMDGKVYLEPSTTVVSLLDVPGYGYSSGDVFDPSFWTELITSKAFDDCVNGMLNECDTALNDALTATTDGLTDLLNNLQAFVFPGGTTFAFNDCFFSDYQDFITKVTYAG